MLCHLAVNSCFNMHRGLHDDDDDIQADINTRKTDEIYTGVQGHNNYIFIVTFPNSIIK